MKTAQRSRDCRCEISPPLPRSIWGKYLVDKARLRSPSLDAHLALDILRTHPVAVIGEALLESWPSPGRRISKGGGGFDAPERR
jgi:hypothetical protein